ncbi:MAG: hypothetical protein JST75_04550 [Bacteroidetes bacterium]|nr:hypothetical protein [Bacteroidota bacterium]
MNTISIPLYVFFNGTGELSKAIEKFARSRRLYFSRLEEISGNLIALDKVKRKLLYFKTNVLLPKCLIVDLRNVDSCTVVKQYDEKEKGKLRTLLLSFRFLNNSSPVSLPFYENLDHGSKEIAQAELKAQLWKAEVLKTASDN